MTPGAGPSSDRTPFAGPPSAGAGSGAGSGPGPSPGSGSGSGGSGGGAIDGDLHGELRELAAALLRRERRDHTLQPTALVHEAYLRLGERLGPGWRAEHGEAAFRALAATAMRRILVDHARSHAADKRGGGWLRVELPEATVEAPEPVELLALHEALEELAALDERKARSVELRFFGGLSGEEVAATLGVARSTAEADWFMARAWLRKRLAEERA